MTQKRRASGGQLIRLRVTSYAGVPVQRRRSITRYVTKVEGILNRKLSSAILENSLNLQAFGSSVIRLNSTST